MNKDIRRSVAEVWLERCRIMNLKPKTKARSSQLEAYLQGVTASLSAAGIMNHDECQQIFFMVYVGRGEETLGQWAKHEVHVATKEDANAS